MYFYWEHNVVFKNVYRRFKMILSLIKSSKGKCLLLRRLHRRRLLLRRLHRRRLLVRRLHRRRLLVRPLHRQLLTDETLTVKIVNAKRFLKKLKKLNNL